MRILRAAMDCFTLTVFFVAAALGAYVQSVTGFALGMILIAVMVGGGLVTVPVITAVVSLLSLVNVLMALHGHLQHLNRRLLRHLTVGLVPALALGVWLLARLDAEARWMLEGLLGLFIVGGSLSMLIRPQPLTRVSSTASCLVAGAAGGVLGGMFSASGPVIGWFVYRQPLMVVEIRATLLAVFAFTTSLRTLVVGYQGGLTEEVWVMAALGLPVVVCGTLAGRRFAPPFSELTLKRFAFGLLLAMGFWTLVRALSEGFFQP
ncbi:MAG: sulfite exporter TauE/SafE family protein [Pseudomonadales bacterium]